MVDGPPPLVLLSLFEFSPWKSCCCGCMYMCCCEEFEYVNMASVLCRVEYKKGWALCMCKPLRHRRTVHCPLEPTVHVQYSTSTSRLGSLSVHILYFDLTRCHLSLSPPFIHHSHPRLFSSFPSCSLTLQPPFPHFTLRSTQSQFEVSFSLYFSTRLPSISLFYFTPDTVPLLLLFTLFHDNPSSTRPPLLSPFLSFLLSSRLFLPFLFFPH